MKFLHLIVLPYGLIASAGVSAAEDDDEKENLLQSAPPYLRKEAYSTGGRWTKVKVLLDKYCNDTYSAEETQRLLSFDMKRGQKWWKSFGEKDAIMCSAYPNRIRNATTYGSVGEHAFFRRRNIRIPILPGVTEKVLHISFRGSKSNVEMTKRKWRLLVDCDCESDSEDELCRGGKMRLSRGVGGDTSFFVHKLDSDGEFSAVAHICFRKSHFRKIWSPSPWWMNLRKSPEWYALLFRAQTRAIAPAPPIIASTVARAREADARMTREEG